MATILRKAGMADAPLLGAEADAEVAAKRLRSAQEPLQRVNGPGKANDPARPVRALPFVLAS